MKDKSKKARGYSSPLLKGLLENRNELETNRTRNRMLLAARIDDLLKAKGWKKKDLAEKLGKTPSVVTKWLSGTHNFTVDTLSDLESVFGEKISISSKVVYPNLEDKALSSVVSEPNFEWGEFVIEMKFEYLKNYFQGIENLRVKEMNIYEENYVARTKDKKWFKMIGPKVEYMFKDLGDHLVSQSFYHSSFLYAFSQFEFLIKMAGKIAKEKSNSRLSPNDLSGGNSEIIKLKKYLIKHLNLEITFNDDLWNKIKAYIDLRNQLIHSSSFIEDLKQKKTTHLVNHLIVENKIDFYPKKNIDEYNDDELGFFRINDIQYLLIFCDDAKKFTNKIFKSLEQI